MLLHFLALYGTGYIFTYSAFTKSIEGVHLQPLDVFNGLYAIIVSSHEFITLLQSLSY